MRPLFAATCLVYALASSSTALAEPTAKSMPVLSPYGVLSGVTQAKLCRSGVVVIGTVSSTQTRVKSTTDGASKPYTQVRLTVERHLKGPGHSSVTLPVPGEGTGSDDAAPRFPGATEGHRYLLAGTPIPQSNNGWPAGTFNSAVALRLSGDFSAPSSSSAASWLRKLCE